MRAWTTVLQADLLKAVFDALALATDLGPPQRYAFLEAASTRGHRSE